MVKNSVIGLLALALIASIATITVHAVEGDTEVRITVRRLDDGRTEFGLQQRYGGGDWGERQFPRARYLPAEVNHDRWLNSSPLTLGPAEDELTADSAASAIHGHLLEGGISLLPTEGLVWAGGETSENIRFFVSRDPFDGTVSTIVRTSEEDPGPGFLEDPLELIILCSDRLRVYVADDDWYYVSGTQEVEWRIDDGPLQQSTWPAIGTAGYGPSDAGPFLNSLRGRSTLTIRLWSRSPSPITLDIEGLLETPVHRNLLNCGQSTAGAN